MARGPAIAIIEDEAFSKEEEEEQQRERALSLLRRRPQAVPRLRRARRMSRRRSARPGGTVDRQGAGSRAVAVPRPPPGRRLTPAPQQACRPGEPPHAAA
mmetsp:Transcript_426/g.1086  ORF Transcript_426/g.1086 Transcript_426/m.1086 type:complete len:100 (-) Transcript_426:1147-1446(-)